jgi:hypothetical protein
MISGLSFERSIKRVSRRILPGNPRTEDRTSLDSKITSKTRRLSY